MTLTHKQAREYMQLALDGRLSPERQAALRAHLAGCPNCAAEQARLATLDRDLRRSLSGRWSEHGFAPAELAGRLAGMEPHIRRKTMSQRFAPLPRALAMMAIVILLVFGAFFISRNFNPQPQPAGPALTTGTPDEQTHPTPTMFPGTLSPTEPAVEPEPTAEPAETQPTDPPAAEPDAPLAVFPGSLNWSPDGRWLAGLDSDRTLLVWNPAQPQGPALRLSLPKENDRASLWATLTWSPDGSQILAYNGIPADLWLVDFSPERLDVTAHLAWPESDLQRGPLLSADWSPDGSSIAFVLGSEAHLYSLNDGQTRTLTQLEQNPLTEEGAFGTYDIVRDAAWSPDGTKLGLGLSGTDCPSPCNGTAVLDLAAGGEPTLLFDMAWMEGWLPDGRLMIRNATGDWTQGYTYDCYAHDVSSGETVNLTRSNPEYDPLLDPPEAYVDAPYQLAGCQSGPNGKVWATLSDYSQGSPDSTGQPALGFVVVDPAAGEPQVYRPEGGQSKTFQHFLADGRLAYALAERAPDWSEHWLIHSLIVDGQPVELPEDAVAMLASGVSNARFSPDGQTLAVLIATGEPADQPTFRVEFINLR